MNDNDDDVRSESHGWSFGFGFSWSGPITRSVEEQFERMKHRLVELKPHKEFWLPQDRGLIDGDGI